MVKRAEMTNKIRKSDEEKRRDKRTETQTQVQKTIKKTSCKMYSEKKGNNQKFENSN